MKPFLVSLGRELWERVILSHRSTILSWVLAGTIYAVDRVAAALLGWQHPAAPWIALALGVVGTGLKDRAVKAAADAAKEAAKAAAPIAILAVLLLAAPARADDASAGAPPPTYGGCFEARGAQLCLGPSVSISLAAIDLKSGEIAGGIIPGVGYGATINPDKWYATGLNLYVNLKTGPVASAMVSGVFSFANYLRIGVGWEAVGGTHSVPLLLGIGTDIR